MQNDNTTYYKVYSNDSDQATDPEHIISQSNDPEQESCYDPFFMQNMISAISVNDHENMENFDLSELYQYMYDQAAVILKNETLYIKDRMFIQKFNHHFLRSIKYFVSIDIKSHLQKYDQEDVMSHIFIAVCDYLNLSDYNRCFNSLHKNIQQIIKREFSQKIGINIYQKYEQKFDGDHTTLYNKLI
jgi:hypothetical protein